MFLKRLETIGFKSFAERTTIEFVPGVTAVVGPNGSGKSNVIDAVRWVLGEQSAKSLRGQKMEDIIFQGSDTRNPLNFAEVSLVINNEERRLPIDFNEVSITRRVYRSGDSDFLINKQACRLKDIVDLFMDTGFGRESFSIIGQGKIDEILSSKAEERRAIFEEAAGVLKYKQRKNKAEFKLAETEDNLNRVEDIIHEIEGQIEPLEKQATVAKVYKEKREQLKQIEIALIVTEIEKLNDEWRTLLKKIEEKQFVEIQEKTRIQEQETKVIQDQQRVQQLDEKINNLQNELITATELLEQFEGKRNLLHERLKHLNENKEKLTNDVTNVSIRHDELALTIQKENEFLQEVESTIKQIKTKIEGLEEKLLHGHDLLKEEIENLKSDYIEYLNEQAVLQNEQQSIERQLTQMEKSFLNEREHNRTFLEERNARQLEIEKVEATLTKQKKELQEKEEAEKQLIERIVRERNAYKDMQNKLYEGNEQIAKYATRKETLQEMKDSFQGYFYGVREVLKASKKNLLAQIDGTVLDLIKVPSTYVTAIDTILGTQVQYVVVPNDEVARNTIAWLKRENKGRATFLPLQSIEARVIPAGLRKTIEAHEGFVGIASDVVETEEKYDIVAKHLMGNVIITDTLQNANAIARLVNRRYRVVTLDGDVVNPGGSMSGGAQRKQNDSLFTREKELADLNKKLVDFRKRAEAFKQKVDEQNDLVLTLEGTLASLTGEIRERKDKLQLVHASHQKLAIELASLEEDLTSYDYHMKEYEENLARLNDEKEKLVVKTEHVKMLISQTEQTIAEKTTEEANITEQEKQIQEQLHELQIRLAEQEERKKSQLAKIDTLTVQLHELKEEQTNLNQALQELLQLQQSEVTEESLTDEIQMYKEKRDSTREQLTSAQVERASFIQKIADEEREIREQYRLHEKLVKEIQQDEVKANRLDVALENRLNHLQTEYVMTYERAAEQYSRVENVDEASELVKNIRDEIKRLGTVNLGAIEEYERILERYNFLKEQQDDLLHAKATLYEAIGEMDAEMVERLSAVFTDIQVAFTEVFQRLFNGGNAELVLTDPGNMLETGIEIIAQPPGKKMKSLGLLSGGERALTAIALLFAILRVKPVPFCILDEVDAALDEANVKRFSNYLKIYSEGTQFIVITHRNGTMEEADVLYGVTMQESGVSRLVSVRLEETGSLVETT